MRRYRRHRPAITRGFLIALTAAIAFMWFAEPMTLAHRWIRSDAVPTDGAYVGRMITTDPAAGAPDILVIGGSSIQILTPKDADVRMSALCGRATHLFNAATSSQHPADSRAILDRLHRPPALIVVGMSYRRLSSTQFYDPYRVEQGRVELPRSPHSFLAAVLRGRLDGGIFGSLAQLRIMDWERTLLLSKVRNLPLERRPGARHDGDLARDEVQSHARKQLLADTMWIVEGDALEKSADAMARYWTDFAHDMQARGSKVLFLMTPLSREADGVQHAYAEPVGRALGAIARAAPVVDMRGMELRDDQFRDPLHLTWKARDAVWPLLSETIAHHGGCRG